MTAQEMTADEFRQITEDIEGQVGQVIVGQSDLVRHTLVTLLAGGNALLEGVPGLGKTMLVRTLAQALDCEFSRIQFTPDLMPADILGTNLIVEDEQGRRQFQFEPGPIFSNLVLADEINRATPKTQSAMLEAMQEHSVTVARSTRRLPEPFFVLATQNPLEMEGTYPLPEAQLDRFFFKIDVPFPSVEDLVEIANRTTATAGPRSAGGQRREHLRHAGPGARRADRRPRHGLRGAPDQGHPPGGRASPAQVGSTCATGPARAGCRP